MNTLFSLSFFLIQAFTGAEWKSYKSTSSVDVFYRTEECHDVANGFHREYILLKFVNKTDKALYLTWQLERYENNACVTCGKAEYKYSYVVPAGKSVEGTCGSDSKQLIIFSKHLDLPNHSTLTKFELGNFMASSATHVAPSF